ncbi:PCRF domain-containing protein [Patescibacteria group bacterium]|nr:PCRF domain-containing protein [Patescibacteria group bacterium]MBU1931680.1 PCRF domain-containing protein [Patescibacteria group bacterium]
MIAPGFVILEVRPGTGGEEAKIWARDLQRMYAKYAAAQNWQVVDLGAGCLKIKGAGVYQKLKHESGVHRVQRIPTTERYDRIHTSTATVAVIPEIPQSEIDFKSSDLEVQFCRSSSQGGQNVQKVSTAVRLKHKPSGLTTTCQTQRYQEQNRKIAEDMLRAKLWEQKQAQRTSQVNQHRAAIGQGMRSEKIRTYNYSQNRVTDHRINKKWQDLENILEGKLDKIIKALN